MIHFEHIFCSSGVHARVKSMSLMPVIGLLLLLTLSSCTAGLSPVEALPTEESVSSADRVLPDRLEIPAIDADMPVVELGWHGRKGDDNTIISEWDVAEYAAGWHKNSALPGEDGNIVLSGHNNVLGSVFRELDLMRAGDEAILWSGGERRVYKVDQVIVVPEKTATPEQRLENAKWIGEFDGERLTMVSCWPRNNNTHRIIVVAYPEDDAQQVATDVESAKASNP